MELPTYDLTDSELDLLTEIQFDLELGDDLDRAIESLRPQAQAALREHCMLCAQRQHDIIERLERIQHEHRKS